MAEINVAPYKKARGSRISTRIDMTPMVDLGFLLITFFVLTTSFMKPTAIDLALPTRPCDMPPEVSESRTLQLFLCENNTLYYYNPLLNEKPQMIDFRDSKDVRNIFAEAKKAVQQKWNSADTMVVIIKPHPKSNYKNMVDILDEMNVNHVKYYALDDFKMPNDSLFLTQQ
jgi:biopolymer transport protein ExbD